MNTPTLMADAKRRAWQIRNARTEAMRRALARRVCFDLIAAMRGQLSNTAAHAASATGLDPLPERQRTKTGD
jgi:hypothetical protein